MGETESPLPKEANMSPFNTRLDQDYPLGSLGFDDEKKERILMGKVAPLAWVSLFRSSPMGNSESEMILGRFVEAAFRAGQWVGLPEQRDEPLAQEGEEVIELPNGVRVNFAGITLEFRRGAELLKEKGFAQEWIDDEGRRWLRPTETTVAFISSRLNPPKKEPPPVKAAAESPKNSLRLTILQSVLNKLRFRR